MSLQFLDKTMIGSYLTAMWKKQLSTHADPANGKWLEDGANHDRHGLYGGLTDSAATQLQLDESSKQYIPEQVVCDDATLDNLNGLAPSSTVTLSYQYANSASTSHSTTDSIKVGVGVEVKASATLFGVGAEVTTKFSFEYTHSWSSSATESTSRAFTFSQSVPVNVPAGKVYKVVLTAMSQKLIVPYTATIAVHGVTETWFEDRVKGHYNHTMSAARAFANIGEWGLAGAQSASYSAAGVSQRGTVTASQTTQFVAKIYDITATYKPQGLQPNAARRSLPVEAVLVQEIPLNGVGSPAALGG